MPKIASLPFCVRGAPAGDSRPTLAIKNNASAVVLAHNHPSGILEASFEDIEFTQKVKSVLSTLGIMLLDHIIVSEGEYISLASKGFI